MTVTRVYQAIPIELNQQLCLDEKASHHLARVLRAKVGDQLIVFNGQGGEYEAVITQINKKNVLVNIANFILRDAESPINIYLAQGIARGEKMDFVVQKAVELGVKKIIPLITERSNVRLTNEREEKRLQHWQAVAISACEQAGRNYIPEILAPIKLTEWLGQVQADKCFVLSPHVQTKMPNNELSKGASIALLIGPEGGLSENEVDNAIQHNFIPLNLGPRILRTETATIAAITALQYRYGDLS